MLSRLCCWAVGVLSIAGGCDWTAAAPDDQRSSVVHIAAAANLKSVLPALIAAYPHPETLEIDVVYGASGQLTQQIISGLPCDLFLSADQARADQIAEYFSGRLSTENSEAAQVDVPEVFEYARGRLVIGVRATLVAADPDQPASEHSVDWTAFSSIAIANPRLAPYGSAAVEYLQQRSPSAIERVIEFPDVFAATAALSAGGVDAAITAASVSTAAGGDGIVWIGVPLDLYSPIVQSGVLIGRVEPAADFVAWLRSPEAVGWWKAAGYAVRTGRQP